MKIGIDARMYGPKVGGGGLGRYVEQLVTKLQEIDQENRYILFLKKENFDLCKITNKNFEKRLTDIHWYTLNEQKFLPKIIDQEKLDLLHFPHWNVPLFVRTPFVVTIHDLILLDDPSSAKATTLGFVKYALKRLGYRAVLWNAINRSQRIISVSHATELSILKHFPKVDPKKIKMIYEGVTSFPYPENHGSNQGWQSLQPPLPPPTFLYIGNSYPHKNLKTLLKAFKIFHQKFSKSRLVLAGGQNIFSEIVKKYVTNINIPKEAVEFVNNPDDQKISELYSQANLYIFPSKLEGFGLPGLEAMAAGVPVIAARAGSLPEVLGEAAVYFDPNSAIELAETMEKIWCDKNQKTKMISLGFEQIKKYSWQKMVEEIAMVYCGVCH